MRESLYNLPMTLRRALSILALLLLTSCKPGGDPIPPPPSPAQTGVLDGEVIEAINSQIEVINQAPGNAQARQHLGLLYLANGAANEAAESLRQAIMIDPTSTQSWYYHAIALEKTNDLDQALLSIASAQKFDPERAALYWRPGFWLLEAGRAAEALPLFQEAAAIESRAGFPAPDAAAHRIGRARCLLDLDRPEEAVLILEELQTLLDHHYASYLLGQAYRRVGRGSEAAPIRATGALDPPSYPDPWLEPISAAGRGLDARLSWIDQLLDSKRFNEAGPAIAEAQERWPDNVNLLNRLAGLYQGSGKSNARIRTLKRAVRIDPNHATSHHNLSLALYQKGDTQMALNHAHLAVKANPSFTPAWLQIGRLLILSGRLDRGTTDNQTAAVNAALEPLDQAFELGVDDPREHLLYGHLLLRAGRLDDATRILGRLIERSDADPKAWAILSEVHAAGGNHRAALSTVIDGLNRFPGHSDLVRIAERYRRAAGGVAPQ